MVNVVVAGVDGVVVVVVDVDGDDVVVVVASCGFLLLPATSCLSLLDSCLLPHRRPHLAPRHWSSGMSRQLTLQANDLLAVFGG